MTFQSDELTRVPTSDRVWLMGQLRAVLDGQKTLLPIGPGVTPELNCEVPDDARLVIHTSGSSGRPKFVALEADALRASASATNDWLGGPGQWLVTLPTHLISGLQMLTRSILGETEPVFFDGPLKPSKFIQQAKKLDADRRYISLVPVQLKRLIEWAETDAKLLAQLQSFDAMLIGGQQTPVELRQRAHELGLKITRTYGMTETAGGVVYDGVEIGDTVVRIRDGEVQLSGSTLALGYLGDDELSAAKFQHDGGRKWFLTGDRGELLGGMLKITGRIDRVIISGGVNVSLDEVEATIAGESDFAEAEFVAVAVPDDEWGTRVVLVTEGAPDTNFLERIKTRLSSKLGRAATPKNVVFLRELPRLDGGKPDLAAARALAIEDNDEKVRV